MVRVQRTRYAGVFVTTWGEYILSRDTEFFDFIVFDLPPTMTDEIKRIIAHCDVMFIPTILGKFEGDGLIGVSQEVKKLGTKLGGIFATMYSEKTDCDKLMEYYELLGYRVMDTIIPYSQTVRESQKAELPLEEYFNNRSVPKTRVSRKVVIAYEKLTREILRRCR